MESDPPRERADRPAPARLGVGVKEEITLFPCGDVTTGRGIDKVRPHPAAPLLCESCVRDARAYGRLAEERTGPIKAPVGFADVRGDVLTVPERVRPAVPRADGEASG